MDIRSFPHFRRPFAPIDPPAAAPRRRTHGSHAVVFWMVILPLLSLSGCRRVASPGMTQPVDARVATAATGASTAAASVTALPPAKPSVRHGGHLYMTHCADCHGVQGDGKGVAAGALKPPPTNFRDRSYMNKQTLEYYYRAVSQGVVGSAMGRWDAQLSEQDRWDVAAYVWSLAVPAGNAKDGQSVYERHCADCHGADGKQVAEAKLGEADLFGRSRDEVLGAIRRSHPEIASSLTDQQLPQRSDLIKAADYIWSLVYAPLVPVYVAVPTIEGLGGSLKLPQGEVCTAEE